MGTLRPNEQRAKTAITLIWIVLAVEIISLLSSYFQYYLLQNMANGDEISLDTFTANEVTASVIGIIYLIVYLISGFTFIQWFRRAYYNLHLKENYLSYGEGWASGSWFVPFLNLYRPYQIMKELYQVTKKRLTKMGVNFNQNFTTSALAWWWTLWILSNFLGQFIFRYSMKAESIEELSISTVASMIGNILGIPLALVTVKIIKDYSNAEKMLSETKVVEVTPTL